jgi:phospholipid/cholesterol/gamma-HCH transport system permease protein
VEAARAPIARLPVEQPPGAQPKTAEDPAVPLWRRAAEQTAGMVRLTGATFRCWITPPFDWWREAVDQGWLLVRRTAIPAMLSLFAFGLGAVAVQGGGGYSDLGAIDRLGAVYSVAALREYVPWVSGMVVAGVAGTAICADLGARKVREELDALAVIGVDVVRTLVAPRVLALVVIMPALNVLGLIFATLSGLMAVVAYGGTVGGFMETFQAGFTLPDLVANLAKTLVFGLLIGVICAFKGLNTTGGSEGVGRAVNQAVVAAFVAIWIFNFAFNSTYLAAFPSTQEIR